MTEEQRAVTSPIAGLGALDEESFRRWVELALVLSAVGYLFVLAVNFFFGPRLSFVLGSQAIVVVVSLAGLALARMGWLRAAVLIPLFTIWVELQATLPVTGGVGDYGLVAFPTLVLAVGIVFGTRPAFGIAALSTVSLSGLSVYAVAIRGVDVDPSQVGYALTITAAAMFATAGMVSLAMKTFGGVVEAARLSEQRSADIIGHAPDGIVVLDSADRILQANPAAERLLATPMEALETRTFAVVLTELAAETDRASLAHLSRPSEGGAPSLVWWTDGSRRHWVEVTARTFSTLGEVGKQLMLRDVSIRQHAIEEQRIIRDRLEEAQRLEAVGRLAGGIAHDFRNLLTVVGNSAELIAEDTDGEPRRLADEIREASNKASSLTGQLLAFARREIIQTELVDVAEVIHFMELGIRHLLGAGVRLNLVLEEHAPQVLADRSQLEQVIFNLTKNAADALGGSGSVQVSLVGPAKRSTGPLGSVYEVPSGFVEIRVSDDGPGMETETLEHVFEPFFTTKATGEGTGLGLSSVHGIVSQNGGTVRLESRPGEGTSVQVLWPLTPPPEVVPEPV